MERIITGKVKNFQDWIDYVGTDHIHHRLMIIPDYAIGVQVTSFVGREKRKVLSQSPRNHALRFIASDSFKIR